MLLYLSRCVCFCASVNVCGTHHAATFFLNKCSVKIRWTVICGIPVSASVSLTITRRSLSSTVVIIVMLVLLITVEGQPRLWVVFCAPSPFSTMFMPPLNGTSVLCCISTNFFQWNVNAWNRIGAQSFNIDVCTLFGLSNISREIFCFIFRQLSHRKISTKQLRKLPHSLRNSVYILLVNKTWFQPVFFQACAQSFTFETTIVCNVTWDSGCGQEACDPLNSCNIWSYLEKECRSIGLSTLSAVTHRQKYSCLHPGLHPAVRQENRHSATSLLTLHMEQSSSFTWNYPVPSHRTIHFMHMELSSSCTWNHTIPAHETI